AASETLAFDSLAKIGEKDKELAECTARMRELKEKMEDGEDELQMLLIENECLKQELGRALREIKVREETEERLQAELEAANAKIAELTKKMDETRCLKCGGYLLLRTPTKETTTKTTKTTET